MEKRYYPATLMTSALAAVITLSLYSLVPVPHKPPATDALRELSAARYLEQVKYLASDEMKGRATALPNWTRPPTTSPRSFGFGGCGRWATATASFSASKSQRAR